MYPSVTILSLIVKWNLTYLSGTDYKLGISTFSGVTQSLKLSYLISGK